jgi:hypothetical protein
MPSDNTMFEILAKYLNLKINYNYF